MDFRQLSYITAVAEHKSITKAAASLFISQPSLSNYIAKTEEELGVLLFDRSTSPISLTYAGEQYLATARKILLLGDYLLKEMRDISRNIGGRIRVGIPRERSSYMFPMIYPVYKKQFPGVDIQIVESNTKTLEELLLSGKVDLIIAPFHVKNSSLAVEKIYEEELLLVAEKSQVKPEWFFKSNPKRVDLKELQGQQFILLKEEHGIRMAVDLLFKAYEAAPAKIIETNSNITAYRLASTGAGITIVPAMTVNLVKSSDNIQVLPITPHPVTWEIVAAYRKDAYIGVPERALLDIARDLFA